MTKTQATEVNWSSAVNIDNILLYNNEIYVNDLKMTGDFDTAKSEGQVNKGNVVVEYIKKHINNDKYTVKDTCIIAWLSKTHNEISIKTKKPHISFTGIEFSKICNIKYEDIIYEFEETQNINVDYIVDIVCSDEKLVDNIIKKLKKKGVL